MITLMRKHHKVRRTRGRTAGPAVEFFRKGGHPYVINWDSIATESRDFLMMGDPCRDYLAEVEQFVRQA